MKRYSRLEILSEINNGNEEILVYLSRKYFSTARGLLRIRGVRDEMTPLIFAEVLATVYSELKYEEGGYADFESYFLNALQNKVRLIKEEAEQKKSGDAAGEPAEVVSKCVSILDEQAQGLLYARVAEKLSYERITEKFKFSNAVIAQYEVNKAFNQLEGIVKVRMNLQS